MKIHQRMIILLIELASISHYINNKRELFFECVFLIFRYPCLLTARMLVQCGADINATDSIRSTPLHILVSNWITCDEILLKFLCDNGAHLDCVNTLRETAMDLISNGNTMQLLKSKMKLSLKCICARLIQNSNVSYHGKIPISLTKFVEEH